MINYELCYNVISTAKQGSLRTIACALSTLNLFWSTLLVYFQQFPYHHWVFFLALQCNVKHSYRRFLYTNIHRGTTEASSGLSLTWGPLNEKHFFFATRLQGARYIMPTFHFVYTSVHDTICSHVRLT